MKKLKININSIKLNYVNIKVLFLRLKYENNTNVIYSKKVNNKNPENIELIILLNL
jgi:hypothetical protein